MVSKVGVGRYRRWWLRRLLEFNHRREGRWEHAHIVSTDGRRSGSHSRILGATGVIWANIMR